MQRKAMLTGMMAVVLATSLTAFTQCRAGLFDGWFGNDKSKSLLKDADLLKKTPRQLPNRDCSFGYNSTTWRPWGTCCETAQPGYSSSPWSGSDMVLPSSQPYDTYEAPSDGEYYPSEPTGSELLPPPDFPPPGDQDLVLPPADPGPLDGIPEDPVPSPASFPPARTLQNGGVPSLEDAAPTDLTLPGSLLPPAPDAPVSSPPVPSTVPLPTPSSIPVGPPPNGQTMRVPGNWQPISYSSQRQPVRQRIRPQPRPRSASTSSQWRVMPGYYGPQHTATPTTYAPQTRR